MKWTDELVSERAAEFAAVVRTQMAHWTDKHVTERAAELASILQAECEKGLRAVRDLTIEECCKAACFFCRTSTAHSPFGPYPCEEIRRYFRETT
ncbi:hypothetical protein LCGC14_1327360 [marine sediment metagenome]|uniref:Uncharacterized protein n=1 Tax=marine sediment metagenome TaxID=412755 RepID=A0A0F9MYK8_9ZZZZ